MSEMIEELTDFHLTLSDLQHAVAQLIKKYGEDAIIYTDAGSNNVMVCIEPDPSWQDKA